MGVFAPGTPGLYKAMNEKCSNGNGDDDDDIVDDIAADQQAEYRIRASKWVASSLVCVQDHMFWYILSASYKARAPIRHLFHILSKYSLQRNIDHAKASPIPVSELPVVDLVTKRLDQLDTEFKEILQSVSSWSNELIDDLQWMVELTGKPIHVEREMLHSISTQLVLHNWAGFRRRVVNMFSGYLVCIAAMWDWMI